MNRDPVPSGAVGATPRRGDGSSHYLQLLVMLGRPGLAGATPFDHCVLDGPVTGAFGLLLCVFGTTRFMVFLPLSSVPLYERFRQRGHRTPAAARSSRVVV
jgi:hypothetical protein